MSFPRYPECKDSGVEWLGQVPVHWYIKPLKYVATYNDEVLPESTSKNYPIKYVEISNVDEQLGITKWTEYPFTSAPSRARRILKDGDVLVSTVRTYLRAIAPVTEPPDGLVGSTGFAVIRPVPGIYYSALLGYVIRAEWFISNIISRSVGVSYPAINASDLVALSLPVPPWKEQKTIAHFLDHETAKVDTLIHEQKRLIELLKEKRQAVISHAVTKGLDPDVPMKDSGVEWLGEVPEHWELVRLKHVLHDMIDTEHKTVHFVEDGDYPVVRTSNIRDGKLLLGNIRYTDREGFEGWTKRGVPESGDIIFTREAPAGEACIVPEEMSVCLGQRTVLLKLKSQRIDQNFCLFSIYSGVASRFIENLSQGSTVSHLNMADIPNMPMLLPPVSEQLVVSEYVRQKIEEYDRLTEAAYTNNSLLQERRSALISAAVTGKVDVRDWQPPADESAFDEGARDGQEAAL